MAGRLNVGALNVGAAGTRIILTSSAHIITAVTGCGVLSLARVNAQLGSIAGPAAICLFSIIKCSSTSILLSVCYRSDAGNSQRQYYTYEQALQKILGGGLEVKMWRLVQYVKIIGSAIGYTNEASTRMMAIQRSICFHISQGRNPCQINSYLYMIAFGLVEIILAQVGDFKRFSVIAVVMSFTYSTIGLGLGFVKVAAPETGIFRRSNMTGLSIGHVIETQKKWRSFQALGDIAFAFSFFINLNEIRDTLFNSPPSDSKNIIMEKTIKFSFACITFFYILCGCLGHAAFGESPPSNLLAGFGSFYNPYWLLNIANVAVSLDCVVAYQVHSRALFTLTEDTAKQRFDEEAGIPNPSCHPHRFNVYRSVCRTSFVMIITLISMFLLSLSLEDMAKLFEILGFWPLTVYLPLRMYIAKLEIKRWSAKWLFLQILSLAFLIINIAAVVGYIAAVVLDYETDKPFKEN